MTDGQPAAGTTPEMSKEEQIGFHKGALSTLAKERQELAKILNIVEQLMQMHVSGLKQLGVDLEAMAKQQPAGGQQAPPAGNQPKMDDLLK